MNTWKGFFQGVGVGLVLTGVAFWVSGAVRRRTAEAKRLSRKGMVLIDGARDADPIALSVRPPEEVSSKEPVASEIPDFAPVSQRW